MRSSPSSLLPKLAPTLATVLAVAAVVGQSPATPKAADRLPTEPWRTPIHSAGNGPRGLEYGLWASGADFKVSFHDGFTFYPLVGDLGPNQPLRWRTASVHRGEHALVDGTAPAPDPVTSDWRCEYRHGVVTEAYDVLAAGVEQTFVLAVRPAGSGDLVITGEITTALQAEPRTARHGEIEFAASFCGPLVRYGKATVVDAGGDRAPVRTAFDGERITLIVDGAFLDSAAYPITVDPLLGRVLLDLSFGEPGFPDVGHEHQTGSGGSTTYVTYTREFGLGDFDGFGTLAHDDLSVPTLVFTDVTAGWSTPFIRNTFVGGLGTNGAWLAVMQHDVTVPVIGTISSLWLHTHAAGDTTLSTATVMVTPPSTSVSWRHPDIGGTGSMVAGTTALIVCEESISGAIPDTTGFLVDPSLGIVEIAVNSGPASGTDRRWPFVSQYCGGSTLASPGDPQNAWLVAWQQYAGSSGDDWDIMASLIGFDGTFGGEIEVGDTDASVHCLHPQVAGQRGSYAITYAKRDNPALSKYAGIDGTALESQRVDWAFGSAPTVLARHMIDDLTVPPNPPGHLFNCCLAFDNIGRDLWAGNYLVVADALPDFVRGHSLAHSGAPVEIVTLFDNGSDDGGFGGCTFDERNRRFPMAYFTHEMLPTFHPLRGDIYDLTGLARSTTYGIGCYERHLSWYEHFPYATADLDGRYVTATRNALGGQSITTVVGATITPPTSASLGLRDDSLSAPLTLPFMFDYPGGSTNTIRVDSNGRVFLGNFGSTDYTPSVAELLAASGPVLCPAWSDLEPTATRNVHYDPSGNRAYVTWNGCPMYPSIGANTFQVVFINGSPDRVEFHYQTFVNNASTNSTRGAIVGFSPGLGALDPGDRDLTAGPFGTAPDSPPLSLDTSAPPRLGTTIGLVTSAIPAGTILAANIMSFRRYDPGIDLASLGMDGCYQYVRLDFVSAIALPGPTWTRSFGVPGTLALQGLRVHSQSATISPGLNPLGVVASNGLQLVLGL
ncbi:MAG: hypothetical protein KDC98_13450 [Planctomycetes bacterium]|nr:hypothetical protein [Planctomycetota bacterium]